MCARMKARLETPSAARALQLARLAVTATDLRHPRERNKIFASGRHLAGAQSSWGESWLRGGRAVPRVRHVVSLSTSAHRDGSCALPSSRVHRALTRSTRRDAIDDADPVSDGGDALAGERGCPDAVVTAVETNHASSGVDSSTSSVLRRFDAGAESTFGVSRR